MDENAYENVRRVVYGESGAQFVPVCERCGRFVRADETVWYNSWDEQFSNPPNATCAKCGRTRMVFEGFIG